MAPIIMAVLMAVIGGPGMAWVFTNATNRRGYEKRKQKFLAGEGPDPDKSPIGPHKSFGQNAVIFGLMFAVLGAVLGVMAPA